jgi:hypothetical protein
MKQIDEPSPEQIALYRSMTPEHRWEAGKKMYWEARRLLSADLQAQNPEWSKERADAEAGRLFLIESLKEGWRR